MYVFIKFLEMYCYFSSSYLGIFLKYFATNGDTGGKYCCKYNDCDNKAIVSAKQCCCIGMSPMVVGVGMCVGGLFQVRLEFYRSSEVILEESCRKVSRLELH